jgi:hypothetical protein
MLPRREHRRLAFILGILGPAHGVRRIRGHHLADHQPVEEHAQRRQALLDRGPGIGLELALDNRPRPVHEGLFAANAGRCSGVEEVLNLPLTIPKPPR